MSKWVRVLWRIALFLRQIAALGALSLAVRVLWLSVALGIAHGRTTRDESHETRRVEGGDRENGQGETVQAAHRPDLDELRSMVGNAPPEEKTEPPPPVPVHRRILVDVGPARSEVFVGKTLVGKTPYGGQIACTSGEEIKVQILPPRGVPIERRVNCRGDTLLVLE